MERREKIQLLNNISKGIIKADSLQPKDNLLKMVFGDEASYTLNHYPCTKEQYEKASAKPNGKKYEVTLNLHHIRSGRPMITSEAQLIEQMKVDGEWDI
jgi:hypothetical protein